MCLSENCPMEDLKLADYELSEPKERGGTKLSRNPPMPQMPNVLGHWPCVENDIFPFFLQTREEIGDHFRLRFDFRDFHFLCAPSLAEAAFITRHAEFARLREKPKNRKVGPEKILGNGLAQSYGSIWEHQRKTIQPLFRPASISAHMNDITSAYKETRRRWDENHNDSSFEVDIGQEINKIALTVICKLIFSVGGLENEGSVVQSIGFIREVSRRFSDPLRMPIFLPGERRRKFQTALKTIDELLFGILDLRLASGGDTEMPDLLDLLIEDQKRGAGIDRRLIRDEMATMFAAGHETIANAITWAICHIALQPGLQDELHQQISNVAVGEVVGIRELGSLPLLESVLSETLRMSPSIPFVPRFARNDIDIEGYRIPKGSRIFISIFNVQRHPEFWENPNVFQPERFINRKASHRCSYIPFGAGPHTCIGNNFAQKEGLLVLANLIRDFRIQFLSDSLPEADVALSLRPKTQVKVRLTRRT